MSTTLPAGWKPIESAPKDSTPVLAFWTGATEAATVYGRSYGITMFKRGEWVNVDNCDDTYSEPTHWMPLPAAPGTPPASAQDDAKDEQAAFEDWMERTCPSGDVEAVQRQWEASSDYADFHAPAAGDARDAERLDFLANHGAHVAWSKDRECCAVFLRDNEGNSGPMTKWGENWLTAREAIDAAIAAQQGKGGNHA